jgi:Tol biopolymer transport system component
MIKRIVVLLTLLVFGNLALGFASADKRVPTIDDLLTIKSVGGTQISPDGKWVAYTVGYGDFKQDAFITQIWLARSDGDLKFQLTRGDRSSTSPHWSPDGKWLAFLSNRQDDRNQIFVISPAAARRSS